MALGYPKRLRVLVVDKGQYEFVAAAPKGAALSEGRIWKRQCVLLVDTKQRQLRLRMSSK